MSQMIISDNLQDLTDFEDLKDLPFTDKRLECE